MGDAARGVRPELGLQPHAGPWCCAFGSCAHVALRCVRAAGCRPADFFTCECPRPPLLPLLSCSMDPKFLRNQRYAKKHNVNQKK